MKPYVFMLLLVLVVALTACSTQDVSEDSNAIGDNDSVVSQDTSLDVMTTVVCGEEQGHVVYTAGGYGCEDGEVAIGLIEEYDSPAICCRDNV